MFVAYIDLDNKGRTTPIPCQTIEKIDLFGDGWYRLISVEQIKEMARPTMVVTEMIVQKKHIEYIIGGNDPSDLPPHIASLEMNAVIEDPHIEENTIVQNTTNTSMIVEETKKKVGRPKGSKTMKKGK